MNTYEKIERMAKKELDEIADKGSLSSGNLEITDKLMHIAKCAKTSAAMDEYSDDYSDRGSYANDGRGGNRSNRGMNDGMSGARRRRDSMGRFSGEDYSYHDAKSEMKKKLKEFMDELDAE